MSDSVNCDSFCNMACSKTCTTVCVSNCNTACSSCTLSCTGNGSIIHAKEIESQSSRIILSLTKLRTKNKRR